MIRLAVRCLFGVSVWFCYTNVSAQDALTPAGSLDPVDKKTETVIRQLPLDAVILFNPEGSRSVLLPGPWSLNVLDDFYDYILRDQRNPVPPFIIRSVSATGTVAGHYVETRIQIEISTSNYRPVWIPLGFKEGILPGEDQTDQPPFRYTGSGSASLTVDPQEGYAAIVTPQMPRTVESNDSDNSARPDITQRHTLSLLLWFPLVQNGSAQHGSEENQIFCSFPQSNSSQFLLEIPMSSVDASVTRGWLLDVQENAERQSTLLRIQGLRTDTEITWGKKRREIADDRPVLLVEKATIDVRLNARSANYDAVLPISSATGSFDQLQIRLPPNCVLDREVTDKYAAAGNYSIEDVNEESVVTVRFLQKTVGPVSIHLRGIQQFEGDKPDFSRDLVGFEVLGAERQTGSLTVSVFPLEMRPRWELIRGVRREGSNPNVTASIAPLISADAGDARFELISQPFLLRVQVFSQQTRINVKPEYEFRFSRGAISMTARLSYTVSGSKTAVLYLQLPDSQWHCEFGTSSLVDTGSVELDESGLLTIPLLDPKDGSFVIELHARRFIASEDEQRHRIALPIPKPQQVTWSEPAPITIVSMNNVEVLPVDESYSTTSIQRTLGLTRQTRRMMPSFRSDPDLQQEPLFYRAETADAVFVADLIFRQQQVRAEIQTDVQIVEASSQVTQTISYHAAYALVDRLYFLIPKSLDTSGNIQVQWGSRLLELRDTTTDMRDNVPDNWVRKLILLPEPMFRFQLTFQYSPPPLTIAADDTVPFVLSFICPAEVPVTDHRIHFFTPSGYKVELQNESKLLWEPYRELRRASSNTTATFRSVQLPESLSPSRIALFVSASERNLSGTTVVERAWLQTWLTGAIRQDWATYRLRSTNDSVTLQLPPDSMREHRIGVRVNNLPVQPNVSPTGLLTIPILPEQYNRPVEVFVDYRYSFETSGTTVPVILPAFAKETLVQSMFWQVMLPPNKHIIGGPAGWTLEYDWAWNGFFWWRVPSIQKSDLGFQSDLPVAESVSSVPSQYVFSSIQPLPYVTFYVVNRSLIILCSSGIALLVGLLLIYVPQTRYAGSLLGLGIALAAVLLYQPPVVLLMLQAAVFGVFLALGTGYVYRIFHRQKQWIPPVFPAFEDMSQHYLTPVPASQTVHEVVMDEESASKETSVVNNRTGMPPNGQS